MKFQVEVPDEVFWKIAPIAEAHELKVPEYTADLLVAHSLRPMPQDIDPILRLWRMGRSDRQIASQLGMTNAAVSSRRQRMHLPANKHPRGQGI